MRLRTAQGDVGGQLRMCGGFGRWFYEEKTIVNEERKTAVIRK